MKSPQCLHVRSEICFRNYVPPVSIENFVAADVNACSGPGDTFCGYQAFLDHALRPLMQIAAGIPG